MRASPFAKSMSPDLSETDSSARATRADIVVWGTDPAETARRAEACGQTSRRMSRTVARTGYRIPYFESFVRSVLRFIPSMSAACV